METTVQKMSPLQADLVCRTEEAIKDFVKDGVESNLGWIKNLEEISYSLFVESNNAFLAEDVLAENLIDESADQWMWDEDCWFMDSFADETTEQQSEDRVNESDISSDDKSDVLSVGYMASGESDHWTASPRSRDRIVAADWILVNDDQDRSEDNDDWMIISSNSDVTESDSDDWVVLPRNSNTCDRFRGFYSEENFDVVDSGYGFDTDSEENSDINLSNDTHEHSAPRVQRRHRSSTTTTTTTSSTAEWLIVCLFNAATKKTCCDGKFRSSQLPRFAVIT